MDASGSSHPPKKLRGDYKTSSGVATGGKYLSVVKELLASSILNAEVGVTAVATLPFITSSISATPEREGGDPTDSVTGPKLRTIGLAERFFISSDSSHHSSTNASGVEVDSIIRIRTEYCLGERRRLESECEKQADLLKARDGEIKNLKAQLLLKEAEATKAIHLHIYVSFTEAAEKARDGEIENLKAQLLLKEAEATKAIHLHIYVSFTEAAEKVHAGEIDALKQKNMALETEKDAFDEKVAEFQSLVVDKERELKDLNIIVSSLKSRNVHELEATLAKLDADLLEMALHLEDKFYPHLLTTISGWRWLLTRGLKLAIVKSLQSSEYLTALGEAISRAIEKGMQSGLSAGIHHGREGRSLTDIAAYKPAAEADYIFALQRLHNMDFPLLAELSSHKDASIEDTINLLCLEGSLANALETSHLQPDIELLTLPIHHYKDQVVLGETSLSFALSVANSRVERIRESSVGTSDSMPTTAAVTTALSTTFAEASLVPSVFVDDYKIVGADDQGDVPSFPTVDFEKEELDTTPKCDPPS
nr:putative transposase (putative), gypsy type [Tanacetum cinerariifolium]